MVSSGSHTPLRTPKLGELRSYEKVIDYLVILKSDF
jgi:hypothetical protein